MKKLFVLEQEDLDKIIQAIKVEIMKEFTLKNFVIEKPMTKEEAADFLKISYKTFERRLSSGHYPESMIHWDGGVMLFFPSELVAAIKRSK